MSDTQPSQPEDWRIGVGRDRRARTRARIIAAAFDLLGSENGLYTRIEDFAVAAGVSRPTFYNHFAGMEELREALSYEVTHDFLTAVTATIDAYDDPRERAVYAVRFYLHRARTDRRWAWSMVNLSANGFIFGVETYRQAEQTIREGIDAGVLPIPSSALGRDILLGGVLAAMGGMLREDLPENYPEQVAEHILGGLGVDWALARDLSARDLPQLAQE